MKTSHALLKMTYMDTCISCAAEPQDSDFDENNNNVQEETHNVNELCENLYSHAAKCEKVHGFNNGNVNGYGYENEQLGEEELVCEFLQSLQQSGSTHDTY